MEQDRPMRRSSLIGPWGVGAIVPFPNDESLMIAGLDMWRYNDVRPFLIEDDRLRSRLNVRELRWPPDYRDRSADQKNCNLTIPAVRFPRWHYCPFCGTMRKASLYEAHPVCDCYQWPKGRKCNPAQKNRKRLVPERFIAICPNGHIEDFPVAEWLHQDDRYRYDEGSCKIRRSTGGTSSSLGGVYYECSCGAKKSIVGVTAPGALDAVCHCHGAQPWLGKTGEDSASFCGESLTVVLSGASNVWFADTMSSIFIPVDDDLGNRKIVDLLDEWFDFLQGRREDGELDRGFVNQLAIKEGVDPEDLYNALQRRLSNTEVAPSDIREVSEEEYRLAEYRVLRATSGSDCQDFHSERIDIDRYDQSIRDYFESISLVHKLKETRAFIGFSRLEPKTETIEERKKILRLGNESWLPAIQNYGEGLFFEFKAEALRNWASQACVKKRMEKLQGSFANSKFGANAEGELRPEFVMIHTFAHLLINQLSFECGYGSSSIRERLYCEKTSDNLEMYGVLIYTASGDSEGSLGGLVRQGESGRIEDMIISAIRNAAWCSSDPVCIQSLGQGPESCNLAACHNCALLPETSCECGNRLLDRACIVGELGAKDGGFFSELLR